MTAPDPTLDRLEAAARAASHAPWFWEAPADGVGNFAYVFGADGDVFIKVDWNPGRGNDPDADAHLIVEMRNALPALLARLRRATEALDRMVVMVDGVPHYRTAGGVPQQMPSATTSAVRRALDAEPEA